MPDSLPVIDLPVIDAGILLTQDELGTALGDFTVPNDPTTYFRVEAGTKADAIALQKVLDPIVRSILIDQAILNRDPSAVIAMPEDRPIVRRTSIPANERTATGATHGILVPREAWLDLKKLCEERIEIDIASNPNAVIDADIKELSTAHGPDTGRLKREASERAQINTGLIQTLKRQGADFNDFNGEITMRPQPPGGVKVNSAAPAKIAAGFRPSV